MIIISDTDRNDNDIVFVFIRYCSYSRMVEFETKTLMLMMDGEKVNY